MALSGLVMMSLSVEWFELNSATDNWTTKQKALYCLSFLNKDSPGIKPVNIQMISEQR